MTDTNAETVSRRMTPKEFSHCMNTDEVRKLLQRAINQLGGSQKGFANRHKLSAAHVNDVLHGRREPGERICKALKISRVVSYVFR